MYPQWMTMLETQSIKEWENLTFSLLCGIRLLEGSQEVTHLTSCFWLNNLKSLILFKLFWVLGTRSKLIYFSANFNFFIFLKEMKYSDFSLIVNIFYFLLKNVLCLIYLNSSLAPSMHKLVLIFNIFK